MSVPRSAHTISRDDISDNALKVLYRLHKAGYEAYLVGGGVRDLLLGLHPKDFDVVTNATPEQVKRLFRNCRLVGRRFRLAHILFGRDVIEVATMRGHHSSGDDSGKPGKHGKQSENGMILRDNVYGSIEEDAERRDFSINALYYNIADFSVLDFAGGLQALKKRKLELIGDPETRYREDPVRMLRAVRFMSKLDLTLSKDTEAPIRGLAPMLKDIPAARLFDESLKLLMAGHAVENYRLMRQYGLFQQLFPVLTPLLTEQGDSDEERFIEAALHNTDERIRADKRVTPAFLFAALLWPAVIRHTRYLSEKQNLPENDAFHLAASEIQDKQQASIAVPKRFSVPAREIWQLQFRLPKRLGRRAYRMVEHPRFRAAYDFLLLRAEIEGGELAELSKWWQSFQFSGDEERQQMLKSLAPRGKGTRRSRRRPRNKPSTSEAS